MSSVVDELTNEFIDLFKPYVEQGFTIVKRQENDILILRNALDTALARFNILTSNRLSTDVSTQVAQEELKEVLKITDPDRPIGK